MLPTSHALRELSGGPSLYGGEVHGCARASASIFMYMYIYIYITLRAGVGRLWRAGGTWRSISLLERASEPLICSKALFEHASEPLRRSILLLDHASALLSSRLLLHSCYSYCTGPVFCCTGTVFAAKALLGAMTRCSGPHFLKHLRSHWISLTLWFHTGIAAAAIATKANATLQRMCACVLAAIQ